MNQKQLQQLIRYCIGFKVVFSYKRIDFWYRTFGICGQYISDTDLSQNKLEKELSKSFQIFNEYIKREKLEKEILNTEYRQYFLLTETYVKQLKETGTKSFALEKDCYPLNDFPYYKRLKPYIPVEYQKVFELLNGIETTKKSIQELIEENPKYTEKNLYTMHQRVKKAIVLYHKKDKENEKIDESFFLSVKESFPNNKEKAKAVVLRKNIDFSKIYRIVKEMDPTYFSPVQQIIFEKSYPINPLEGKSISEIGVELRQLDSKYHGSSKEILKTLTETKKNISEYYETHQEEIESRLQSLK